MLRVEHRYVVEAVASLRTNLALLRLGVALRRHHAEFGTYPAALRGLVEMKILARLPADAFAGGPFRYRVEEGEFTLYSVGRDQKDDGGDFESSERYRVPPDRGFRSALDPPTPYVRSEVEEAEETGEEDLEPEAEGKGGDAVDEADGTDSSEESRRPTHGED
jgi:hypothetical protein